MLILVKHLYVTMQLALLVETKMIGEFVVAPKIFRNSFVDALELRSQPTTHVLSALNFALRAV